MAARAARAARARPGRPGPYRGRTVAGAYRGVAPAEAPGPFRLVLYTKAACPLCDGLQDKVRPRRQRNGAGAGR